MCPPLPLRSRLKVLPQPLPPPPRPALPPRPPPERGRLACRGSSLTWDSSTAAAAVVSALAGAARSSRAPAAALAPVSVVVVSVIEPGPAAPPASAWPSLSANGCRSLSRRSVSVRANRGPRSSPATPAGLGPGRPAPPASVPLAAAGTVTGSTVVSATFSWPFRILGLVSAPPGTRPRQVDPGTRYVKNVRVSANRASGWPRRPRL